MAAARWPPSSDPATVQFLRHMATARSSRSAGVVGHAQAAVVEEAGEDVPALEAVVDRLGGIALARELAAPLAQPRMQRLDERPAALGADEDALLRHQAVDLALDGKQGIDALERL